MLVAEVYVRNFDGWGAWAAAPLLLVPGLIGLVLAIAGLVDFVAAARSGRPLRSALVFTLVAALPIFWLAIRRFVV